MFTGIVSRLGQVESIAKKNPTIVRIACPDGGAPDRIGASVACAGICLTATSVDAQRGWFEATLSDETLAVTTAGEWLEGRPINLERPLRLGDELGGHLVAGHVDGVVELVLERVEGEGKRMTFAAPDRFAPLIAPKGSVAIDGVSLTVAAVDGNRFDVAVIPHTLKVTSLGTMGVGDRANLEVDTIARYLTRMQEFSHG